MKSRSMWQAWWEDESGQATTEYILVLSISVGLFILVVKNILKPALATVTERFSSMIENSLFRPGSMHKLNLGR